MDEFECTDSGFVNEVRLGLLGWDGMGLGLGLGYHESNASRRYDTSYF